MTVDFANALEYKKTENPQSMDELIEQLAYLRLVQKNIKDQLDEIKKRLASDPDLLLFQCFLSDANAQMDELDTQIRKLAIESFGESANKHPHPAIEIKEVSNLVYDDQLAIMWCMHHLPNALQLNRTLFEKHARSISDTSPIKFVSIKQAPKAFINTDLSAFYRDTLSSTIEER